jgi:hypothetical protein
MTVSVTKHYEDLCDMPQCICALAIVAMFLKNDLLTTDGKPYITGEVQSVTETGSGGVDVVIEYDDATMPLDGPYGDPIEVSFGDEGTACNPDCLMECEWLAKAILLVGASTSLINRSYKILEPGAPVVDGAFDIPRIPFASGLLVAGCSLSCFEYDIDTEADFVVSVGAQVVAIGSGNLASQLQLALVSPLIAFDAKPVLTITNLVNNGYSAVAEGLVLEFTGIPRTGRAGSRW